MDLTSAHAWTQTIGSDLKRTCALVERVKVGVVSERSIVYHVTMHDTDHKLQVLTTMQLPAQQKHSSQNQIW